MRTLSRGVEAAREGTPQNVRFDNPFLTVERVRSAKKLQGESEGAGVPCGASGVGIRYPCSPKEDA